MDLTHFETVCALLVAILTSVGLLAAGLRWVYRQGAANTKLLNSVDANTAATNDLTVAYKAFTQKTADTILDHEKRITRLETTTEFQRSKGA